MYVQSRRANLAAVPPPRRSHTLDNSASSSSSITSSTMATFVPDPKLDFYLTSPSKELERMVDSNGASAPLLRVITINFTTAVPFLARQNFIGPVGITDDVRLSLSRFHLHSSSSSLFFFLMKLISLLSVADVQSE